MDAGASVLAPRLGDTGLRRLASVLAAVSLSLALASIVLLAREAMRDAIAIDGAQTIIIVTIFAVAFPVLGLVILRRQPANAVGWVYLAVGFWQALSNFAAQYSNVSFETASGSWPLAAELSWVAIWAWTPGFALFASFGVLLFPDGHLPSRRWWPVAALASVSLVLMAVPIAIASWPFRGATLEAAATSNNPQFPTGSGLDLAFTLSTIGQLVLLVAMVGAVAGLVTRFRKSRVVERQQMKWFTYAAVLDITLLIIWTVPGLGPVPGALTAFVFAPAMPVAIGVAILRYRLYEIDRIISRTLVYGLLTAVLAGLYAASVGLMQRVSQAVTGANTDAAVVLTTLIVVTAFTPVKSGLQRVVDRRFAGGRDPRMRLREFTDRLEDSVSPLDPGRTIRRFLAIVLESCDLAGGRIELEVPGGTPCFATLGQIGGGWSDSVSAAAPGPGGDAATIRLELHAEQLRRALAPGDREAIQDALQCVARELAPSVAMAT
jgi:hypothetical protein